MSGGPQVFLGATTFLSDCVCLNASPPDLRPVRGRAAWCARGRRPAREPSAPRASLGASSRSPARPRRRPRAPQPGPAAAHGHRSLAPPPPTGTAAWPRPCPPVPPAPSAPVGSGVLTLPGTSSRNPPGPAAAHGPRSLAPTRSHRPRMQLSCTSLLSSPISHAISLRSFQILKLDRWNCNVFRLR